MRVCLTKQRVACAFTKRRGRVAKVLVALYRDYRRQLTPTDGRLQADSTRPHRLPDMRLMTDIAGHLRRRVFAPGRLFITIRREIYELRKVFLIIFASSEDWAVRAGSFHANLARRRQSKWPGSPLRHAQEPRYRQSRLRLASHSGR